MSAFEGRDPIEDYKIINKELENFNKKIMDKPQIVIANKMDMESSIDNLERFKKEVNCEVYPISAQTGEGIDEVLIKLADMLDTIEKQQYVGYYDKMAVAWFLSIAYIKFPSQVEGFLLSTPIDTFVFSKTISKICDSYQVKKEAKIHLRKLASKFKINKYII